MTDNNLFSDSPPATNAAEYTVSELSGALRRTVEDQFGNVRVRGEISGYRGPHSSGHAYFSLKDERAKIDAAKAEREGDLNRAAELKYGILISLENDIKAKNAELAEIQKDGGLLKEEVGPEDVAEVVAKWTGIPVSRASWVRVPAVSARMTPPPAMMTGRRAAESAAAARARSWVRAGRLLS